jgi:hypothetical protein
LWRVASFAALQKSGRYRVHNGQTLAPVLISYAVNNQKRTFQPRSPTLSAMSKGITLALVSLDDGDPDTAGGNGGIGGHRSIVHLNRIIKAPPRCL